MHIGILLTVFICKTMQINAFKEILGKGKIMNIFINVSLIRPTHQVEINELNSIEVASLKLL